MSDKPITLKLTRHELHLLVEWCPDVKRDESALPPNALARRDMIALELKLLTAFARTPGGWTPDMVFEHDDVAVLALTFARAAAADDIEAQLAAAPKAKPRRRTRDARRRHDRRSGRGMRSTAPLLRDEDGLDECPPGDEVPS